MNIDKIKVCKPIQTLIELLEENDFNVIESRIEDYHFHEVFIKLNGGNVDNIPQINIDKIDKISRVKFACSCHWSVVELCSK